MLNKIDYNGKIMTKNYFTLLRMYTFLCDLQETKVYLDSNWFKLMEEGYYFKCKSYLRGGGSNLTQEEKEKLQNYYYKDKEEDGIEKILQKIRKNKGFSGLVLYENTTYSSLTMENKLILSDRLGGKPTKEEVVEYIDKLKEIFNNKESEDYLDLKLEIDSDEETVYF